MNTINWARFNNNLFCVIKCREDDLDELRRWVVKNALWWGDIKISKYYGLKTESFMDCVKYINKKLGKENILLIYMHVCYKNDKFYVDFGMDQILFSIKTLNMETYWFHDFINTIQPKEII